MQKFLKSNEYLKLKIKSEKEYFKLGGEYAWYDGDKIVKRSAPNIAEYFKNKKVIILQKQRKMMTVNHTLKLKVRHFIKCGQKTQK